MKHVSLLDENADPFGEHPAYELALAVEVLGGRFHFASNAQALLELVRQAYAELPSHRLDSAAPLEFEIRLRLVETAARIREAPPLQLSSGGGMLCGHMDAYNFAVISPAQRSALVSISSALLEHPYHARYELIEFAVYTLAARSQSLIAMHAACVGRAGKGVLIIGETGAGKSTLALHCLHMGLQLISEDSVFVVPHSLAATGVGTFLHLRAEDPLHVDDPVIAGVRKASGTIRRRSGVIKHALDLRRVPRFLAREPLTIAAIVFLSRAPAADSQLLTPLAASAVCDALAATQAYAATQPRWPTFLERAKTLPAFQLRRAHHPKIAAQLVRELLDSAL